MKTIAVALVALVGCAGSGGDVPAEHVSELARERPSMAYVSPALGERACEVTACLLELGVVERVRIRESAECGVVVRAGDGSVSDDGCQLVVELPEGVDACEWLSDL